MKKLISLCRYPVYRHVAAATTARADGGETGSDRSHTQPYGYYGYGYGYGYGR